MASITVELDAEEYESFKWLDGPDWSERNPVRDERPVAFHSNRPSVFRNVVLSDCFKVVAAVRMSKTILSKISERRFRFQSTSDILENMNAPVCRQDILSNDRAKPLATI